MCPGNNESAGKHRSGRTRKGSPWLRTALVEAAQAASRTKDTYLSAQFARLRRRAGRTGHKKAVVAVGHTLLVIAYHILDRHQGYEELGADYFTRRENTGAPRPARAPAPAPGLPGEVGERCVEGDFHFRSSASSGASRLRSPAELAPAWCRPSVRCAEPHSIDSPAC